MKATNNILLVANWESNVGYAWWLMENFWVTIADVNEENKNYLIYPKINDIPDSILNTNIEVLKCNFSDRSPQGKKNLKSIIQRYQIDTIYLTDQPSYSLFYLILRLWGIKKIIIHEHTPGERNHPSYIKKLLKLIVQRIPAISANYYIAVTDYILDRFINISCIPKRKCFSVQNGIKPIDLSKVDKLYAYSQFNINRNKKIIVSTGRATYQKGIDFFVECANALVNKKNIQNVHFLFCGDGKDLDDFKLMAKRCGLENKFTFTGKRTDVRLILPSCHVGFHASRGEVGYSLSILEYMSAGLVTVLPDNPSISLATEDNSDGLLYKPRDIESATEVLIKALSPENKNLIGHKAVEKIMHNFDIKLTNRKLRKVMRLIIDS
jgi:glycosyltransferase involved in cell wall biosynthesis